MHMSIRRMCTPPNLPTKSSLECCESASTVLAEERQRGLCLVQWRMWVDWGGATSLLVQLATTISKSDLGLSIVLAESLIKKALRVYEF